MSRRSVAAAFLLLPAALILTAATGAAQLAPPASSPTLELDPSGVTGDPDPEPHASSAPAELTGTFRLAAGSCAGQISGSWFRMTQPGGGASGPFVSNGDSPCSDKTYTPLRPGSDGGLTTGGYQPHPEPAFASNGAGRASRITAPQRFYGVEFATATNPVDPQTGTRVAEPRITTDGGRLGGDLRAFAAAWNTQHFNQGAPKPDGTASGSTTLPQGDYDARSGRYSLTWTSQISGGPFNNFTGVWHLEGTFVAHDASEATPGGTPGTGPSASGLAGSASGSTSGGSTGAGRSGTLASTGPGPWQTAGLVLLLAGLMVRTFVRRAGLTGPQRG